MRIERRHRREAGARPDAPVLAAVGDGGFSMNCQELRQPNASARGL
jgi:hypothetical protein